MVTRRKYFSWINQKETKDVGEGSKKLYRMTVGHCTRHSEPKRDTPENPKLSELSVLSPPFGVGQSLGGTQALEAG